MLLRSWRASPSPPCPGRPSRSSDRHPGPESYVQLTPPHGSRVQGVTPVAAIAPATILAATASAAERCVTCGRPETAHPLAHMRAMHASHVPGTRASVRRGCSAGTAVMSLALCCARPIETWVSVDDARQAQVGGAHDAAGVYHSQVGQDYVVISAFNGKRNGTFVDLAANDPIVFSNTRTLERDWGWTGACIEPQVDLVLALARRRTCRVVHAL